MFGHRRLLLTMVRSFGPTRVISLCPQTLWNALRAKPWPPQAMRWTRWWWSQLAIRGWIPRRMSQCPSTGPTTITTWPSWPEATPNWNGWFWQSGPGTNLVQLLIPAEHTTVAISGIDLHRSNAPQVRWFDKLSIAIRISMEWLARLTSIAFRKELWSGDRWIFPCDRWCLVDRDPLCGCPMRHGISSSCC